MMPWYLLDRNPPARPPLNAVYTAYTRIVERDAKIQRELREAREAEEHLEGLQAQVTESWRRRFSEAHRKVKLRKLKRESSNSAATIASAGHELAELTCDRSVRIWAEMRRKECEDLLASISKSDQDALTILGDFAAGWGISPPELIGTRHVEGCVMRLCSGRWWRSQARKVWAQLRESRAIASGAVGASSGLYVSEEMMRFVRSRRADMREMLEGLEAVSDAGDVVRLVDCIDASVSNPDIRCTEMMVRNAGMEFVSQCRGDVAVFLTLTLASKYHARTWKNMQVFPNPNYAGTTPREGQARLAELWDGAVRTLRKEGVKWYGSRFVQPHHDGTPHWHLLVYVEPGQRDRLIDVMRAAVLTDDPDEPGASRRRLDVVLIDTAKGSAIGYVARYISRALNGKSIKSLKDKDDSGRQRKTADVSAVERVAAWASIWRIRLFQFIGTPPVTVWRELRRLRAPVESGGFALEKLRSAADGGDYAEWLELMGGVCAKKREQTAQTMREPANSLNLYGEEPANSVKGVQLSLDFSVGADPELAIVRKIVRRRARRRGASRRGQDRAVARSVVRLLARPDVAERVAARRFRLRTRVRTWIVERSGNTVLRLTRSM